MDLSLLAWGMRGKGSIRNKCVSTPLKLLAKATGGGSYNTAECSGHCRISPKPSRLPRIWLFTDDLRVPNPRDSVAALPRARAGVVLRHDHDPARAALGRDLARICRARRLVLVVAGDPRLAAALKAGSHLRGGRWPAPIRPPGPVTSSAHSVADLRRARRAGAGVVFLSPAFPTASHIGTPGLGPLRWAAIAHQAGISGGLGALGGVDGQSVKRLPPRLCRAIGAIGALSRKSDLT